MESSRKQSTSSRETQQKRSYDASGRQAEAQARRRRVIEEARRLFLERGYGATSIADIASAAGVSSQMVYAAFESKAGVLSQVADVAVAGDDEDAGLARDRPDFAAVFAPGVPARERMRSIASVARIVHGRSAPVLRIVETVAGADPAVAALQSHSIAASRGDAAAAIAAFGPGELRDDLSDDELTDTLNAVAHERVYSLLTVDRGWTPERYESWLDATLARLLLP